MIHLGTAGWSLSRPYFDRFPSAGSQLQRYSARLDAVEINSSFYRPHRPATYARWAASVPPGFRFSVKLPQAITHERRLVDCQAPLEAFLGECTELGAQLGCLLVQLPPSLAFEPVVARGFLEAVRQRYAGPLAIEPRHASWRQAQALLVDLQVAQVAADPPRFANDAAPSGWPGLVYWRLHGVPRIYYSDYPPAWLEAFAQRLRASVATGVPTWCIFDNTAAGAALGNALAIAEQL
ncbi:DUF72 domain-containing protein [Pseudomonas sp. Marseille-QA0332]